MAKKYYEFLGVSTYSYIDDESLDVVLKSFFPRSGISKRVFSTKRNKITKFYVESPNLTTAQVKKFEAELKHNGFKKLYSTTYSIVSEVDARFFTINFNPEHFSDMRDLLIQKIEKVLGKKLKTHEEIYYFWLTKSEAKSELLYKRIEVIMDNPAIEIIIGL
jgi:hypothetical protein